MLILINLVNNNFAQPYINPRDITRILVILSIANRFDFGVVAM